MEYLAEGGPDRTISLADAGRLLDGLLAKLEAAQPLRRVLLLPPDHTRLHSWAGELTVLLYERLAPRAEVVVLPALGTHAPMPPEKLDLMFPNIPHDRIRVHDWRNEVATIGEVPASLMRDLSEGQLDFPADVQVNRLLLEGKWDAILSVGQLVPHEVIGIANGVKNVFVGAGGTDLINKSHYLGAVYGMERIMGRADTPVRALLDYAAGFAKHLPITYLLTVRSKDAAGHLVTRGLYAGTDAACFRRGAELCRRVNLDVLPVAPDKIVVYLDPVEFTSTWLGNKAVYRTRMAIADGGELLILGPGVKEFGEDHGIDRLIRQFGYRGRDHTLAMVREHPELAANLSAAAHLMHGSSNGRFRITYCPGHLTRAEIEATTYGYGDLATNLKRYGGLSDGWNTLPDGERVYYVSNPALGLWGTADRFGAGANA